MKNKPIIITPFLVFIIGIASVSAHAEVHSHHKGHHSSHMPRLSEAGNDAFGTIQEIIARLRANPKTDWSKVNLEALRQHLVDMRNFTLEVTVLKQKRIKLGLSILLKPNNPHVAASLERVFSAHPAQFKKETGWTMTTARKNGNYVLTVTAKTKADALKIQGLGFIGVMAWGKHHQPHHWMIATGGNPH